MTDYDTGLETCIKCKHMTMDAPMGIPYFICHMDMGMENEQCKGFASDREHDEHEDCFNKGN